jgi:hypothetical protein
LVEPHDDHVVLGGASLNNIDLDQGRAAIGRPAGVDLRPGQRGFAACGRALRVHP